jgi:hypothetical protein
MEKLCRSCGDLPAIVGIQIAKNPEFIAAAQTHAILALAAATALDSDSREWLKRRPVPRSAANSRHSGSDLLSTRAHRGGHQSSGLLTEA